MNGSYYPIANIEGLEARMNFRSQNYFILPGVDAYNPRLNNFRLDLYCRLTSEFGYFSDQPFLPHGAQVNYGNLLYNTAKSDDPAFYELADNATDFRKANGLEQFPAEFVRIYEEEWDNAFVKFVKSDPVNINFTNGSSSGPPLYLKSSLSKVELVKNFLSNGSLIKKSLHTYNMKSLFYQSAILPVAAPVKRTRNDKAAIFIAENGKAKERVKERSLSFLEVKKLLREKKIIIQGKPRPIGTQNGIDLKEYIGYDILYTPSRLAYSFNGTVNYILQPIATTIMSEEPGYKMTGYDEYELILEQGLFADDGTEFIYLIVDYSNFDRYHDAILVKAFIRSAYRNLPEHTARLIEIGESVQLPRFSKNFPGFYLNRDPFQWDPDFLKNFVSLQSGVWHTSITGKLFTRAAIRYALNWSFDEMKEALRKPSKNKPFVKDGGDDVWLKIKKQDADHVLKVLNTIMDVKLEIPAAFLGLKFLQKQNRLTAVPDPASYIKSFNPENKSSNFLKYKGLTYDQVLLYYSINPDFSKVRTIAEQTFDKHFNVDLNRLMKMHSNTVNQIPDLTMDELFFLMKPEKLHYTELKIRDSIKQLFFTSSEEIIDDLTHFLKTE